MITEEEAKKEFFEAPTLLVRNHSNYVYIYDYETCFRISNPGVAAL